MPGRGANRPDERDIEVVLPEAPGVAG